MCGEGAETIAGSSLPTNSVVKIVYFLTICSLIWIVTERRVSKWGPLLVSMREVGADLITQTRYIPISISLLSAPRRALRLPCPSMVGRLVCRE